MTITQIGTLQSVQVGTPHRYSIASAADTTKRSWKTSFFRTPSVQSRWLYTTHLEGNMQADTKNHGQLSQEVLLYAAAYYPLWQTELGLPEIGPGGFGENFTVDGLTEEKACIGDIYAIGEAQIQVTGPRYPCWKIERRWGIEGLTARVAEPGMFVTLIERPYPEWTVALTNDFGHSRNKDVERAEALAACPLLHEFWQQLVVRGVMRKKK